MNYEMGGNENEKDNSKKTILYIIVILMVIFFISFLFIGLLKALLHQTNIYSPKK